MFGMVLVAVLHVCLQEGRIHYTACVGLCHLIIVFSLVWSKSRCTLGNETLYHLANGMVLFTFLQVISDSLLQLSVPVRCKLGVA